jgi:hypothetical protein
VSFFDAVLEIQCHCVFGVKKVQGLGMRVGLKGILQYRMDPVQDLCGWTE